MYQYELPGGGVSSSVSGAGSLGLEDRYGRKITSMIKIKQEYYPDVIVTTPEECTACTGAYGAPLGGAVVVIEVAGAEDSFHLAWQSARPNAIVTVVALYDRPQILPLPDMYGKNLTFKTGGVDGCDCAEILSLIEQGLIDTRPLITHWYSMEDIEEAYRVFENREPGVIKVAIDCLCLKSN